MRTEDQLSAQGLAGQACTHAWEFPACVCETAPPGPSSISGPQADSEGRNSSIRLQRGQREAGGSPMEDLAWVTNQSSTLTSSNEMPASWERARGDRLGRKRNPDREHQNKPVQPAGTPLPCSVFNTRNRRDQRREHTHGDAILGRFLGNLWLSMTAGQYGHRSRNLHRSARPAVPTWRCSPPHRPEAGAAAQQHSRAEVRCGGAGPPARPAPNLLHLRA